MKRYTGKTAWRHAKFIGQRYDRYVSPYAMAGRAQSRHSVAAQAYLARRITEGKTRREAVRALKRFIVRAIWRQWQACQDVLAQPPPAVAA